MAETTLEALLDQMGVDEQMSLLVKHDFWSTVAVEFTFNGNRLQNPT